MMDVVLSLGEKTFLVDGVKDNCRSDGRKRLDYRSVHLETNIFQSCAGSAHIKLGNCEIVVGVKSELTEPEPTSPDQGKVEFAVDISPNAAAIFEGKRDAVQNNLVSALTNSIPQCMNLADLCVIKSKHVWCIYVDILILEFGSTSNLFDASSIAVKAALSTARISKVTVDEDTNEIEVAEDPFDTINLDVSRVPLFITVTRISNQYVVDATQEEEACSISSVLLAVCPNGEIVHSKKIGSGSLHPDPLKDVLQAAKDLSISMHQNIIDVIALESKVKKSSTKTSFLM